MAHKATGFDFGTLVFAIQRIDQHLAVQAGKAVNVSLTLRNWLMGLYIAEYELRGADRANYGENLLNELSKELQKKNVSNTGRRQLYQYLSFYRTYPQIVRTVPAQLALAPEKILGALSYSHLELLVGIENDLHRTRAYQR